ncbi:MAG TPA: EFR1 family ferrodoxin [Bacillota bacterium]|nr:EFR1 family ferrodoxin [Bacillota bacterium]
MTYRHTFLYFLSGTGNSYRVASWLAEAARDHGCGVSLHSIDRGLTAKPGVRGADTLLGLVQPTHGFTAPWPMVSFALRLPRGAGTHAIILPTRAGTKVGPLFLPGMQGTAGYLLALILLLKGYNIRGVLGIDMPSNWTALHWGIKEQNARAIIGRAKEKSGKFIQRILAGQRYFRGLVELIIGLGILPVSVGYLLYGRMMFAKLLFATDKCNGCGSCATNCPAGAIKMHRRKPYWTYKCESCMRCMNFCPAKAIEASHPLALVMSWVTGIPVAQYILNRAGQALPILHLKNPVAEFLLQYSYFLLAIWGVYGLFTLANRVPIISKLFRLLTPTNYFRRYHEPDTKVHDLTQ